MEYNRHIGIPLDECYQQCETIIRQIARKSRGALKDIYAMDINDLYQIATIGFINAYNEYEPSYSTTFTSYMHTRVKWELYNTLKKRHSIHFPNSYMVIWNLIAKYRITCENLHELEGRKPSSISNKTVKGAMEWLGRTTPSSLDMPSSTNIQGEKDKNLYDVVAGSYTDESVAVVNDFLSTLNKKQTMIVCMLIESMTQSEIAKEIGLSQSQVSRNIKAIQKLWLAYTEEANA